MSQSASNSHFTKISFKFDYQDLQTLDYLLQHCHHVGKYQVTPLVGQLRKQWQIMTIGKSQHIHLDPPPPQKLKTLE